MEMHLAGKVAPVTGSSGGIGAGIAATLAREGAAIVVHGCTREGAEQIATDMSPQGGQASVAIGDLTTDEGAAQVVEEALAAQGRIDILINIAFYP
jgi:3-oxoacyl-[acyl-carrier protein] reductase